MRGKSCLAFAGGLMAACALASPAWADGVLGSDSGVVNARSVKVNVEVFEQVATTTAEIAFPAANEKGKAFVFPVPEGATVTGFWTLQDGEWQSAVLNPEEPSTVEDVAGASGGNTALGVCGREHPFVIELPDDASSVRVEYVQVLPYSFGEVEYTYPLAPCEVAQLGGYDAFEIHMDVTSARRFAGYSAPGFGALANVQELSDNHLRVSYNAKETLPPDDFRFTYGVEQDAELYVNLLTDHVRCGEDGYFLLIVEPVHDIDESAAIPKSFSFVMDVSGSMDGYKLEQVRTAAKYFVLDLNEQDSFNVICFDDYVDPLFASPQPATAGTRQSANQFLDAQYADGSTDIHQALMTAMKGNMEESSARIVVLLTDGQPTAGVTNSTQIVNEVTAANTSHARLFTFGVGFDVNEPLLTALATSNHGEAHFLAANEDIATALATFYETIDLPVLTDVSMSFGNMEVYDVLPAGFTDLYAGSQLFVLGRYRQAGETEGSLTGRRKDEQVQYTYPLTFPECAADAHAFPPCLWAKAKVDALITEMLQSGMEDPAKVEQIEQLANRCGLQTPYTSYGVDDSSAPGRSTGSSGSGSSDPGASTRYPGSYSSGGLEESSGCQMGRGPSSGIAWMLALLAGAALLRRR